MIRLGVIGAGHLGEIHVRCIQGIEGFELVGFHDSNKDRGLEIEAKYGVRFYEDLDEMMALVDALDIVTPTSTHYDLCSKALKEGKHVFVEKPICSTLEEADSLAQLHMSCKDLKFQVGHVERFNPAFVSIKNRLMNPRFIEVHRLANFNPRSTDVSVVHDLMIHDIDIILHLVDSRVTDVVANGVTILSRKPDICNARLTFENGCVANITASRLSLKNMRKMRLFQEDAYISIDFLEKVSEIVVLTEEEQEGGMSMPLEVDGVTRYISMEVPDVEPVNAIQEELRSFYDSIRGAYDEKVPLADGRNALEVVEKIASQI